MKYIKYLFLAIIGLVLMVFALANRGAVTLRLMPEELASVLDMSASISLPLFVVMFLGIVAGLLIGFVWEWLREFSQRRELARKEREVHRLEREVRVLKAKTGEDTDDVLALVE
ncbi:MAG: LapA family protein [Pseudomonadota bacterium]